jgi:hypothetical protein
MQTAVVEVETETAWQYDRPSVEFERINGSVSVVKIECQPDPSVRGEQFFSPERQENDQHE